MDKNHPFDILTKEHQSEIIRIIANLKEKYQIRQQAKESLKKARHPKKGKGIK